MDENMALTPYETREILFYKTDNGDVKVEILLYQENLWLTQAKMAELFEVQKAAISKHLKNIFTSGELMEDSVVSVLETTAADGKNYPTRYYNLDAIIAVGYRVNSKKATMFRIWANRILKEYIIKGYVMDDERLKEPQNFFGKDYFEEQLERIRDIRASERRFYQKITDIYSQCSADYDVDSPVTKEFFATVQNKLHYAITKHTAAEIIYDRADSTKPNMGLTTWKNAPSGRIRKSDVVIAKNYLDETEMGSLNEIVTMYLDYAERQARRGNIMYMKDWVARLDAFLQFNAEEVLHHKGKVTAAIAKAFATDLKSIYQAPTEEQGRANMETVTEKWQGKYPNAMKSWSSNWDAICPIFKFSAEVRKVIYTTNAIESLNSTYRRLNSQRSVFPSPTALMKALYLATFEASKKWTSTLRNWGRVYGELSIMYDGRLPEQQKTGSFNP